MLRREIENISDLSDGEFGCLASHLALMQYLVDSDAQQIIVLEDDVSIPKNFYLALTNVLEKAPLDYDIIYLSYNTDMHINVNWPGLGSLNFIHDNKEISAGSLVNDDPNLLELNRAWGLPAYLISKAGAKKILSSLLKPKNICQFQIPNGYGGMVGIEITNTNPIDLHVLANMQCFKALVSFPMIAFPNMDQSTSIIGNNRSYS